MSKKCYRFFGGLLNAQAKWLNKMSEKGYRLVRTGRPDPTGMEWQYFQHD